MRTILLACALLLASSGAAMGQMGGAMMWPGMMPGGMMAQDQGMMGGGMRAGMMPCMMMGQVTDGMMPAHAKGCVGMAGGMMMGNLDMSQLQEELGLTAEQADRLKAIQRPLQKEAIRIGADMKVADIDVADLLSADKVDLGKVEAKLKELESLRTKKALTHLRAAEEVKKIISREQLEKFQGMCQGGRQVDRAAPPAPAVGTGGPRGSGGQPQEHHPAQ